MSKTHRFEREDERKPMRYAQMKVWVRIAGAPYRVYQDEVEKLALECHANGVDFQGRVPWGKVDAK